MAYDPSLDPRNYNNTGQYNLTGMNSWMDSALRSGTLSPSDASNLMSYGNAQGTAAMQAWQNQMAYEQAQRTSLPASRIGEVLSNRALQSAMGQAPGMQAIGGQFRNSMKSMNRLGTLPSTGRSDASNAMRERLAMALATERQRSFAGDVDVYGKLAGSAGLLSQTTPLLQYNPNANNYMMNPVSSLMTNNISRY